MTTTMIAPPPDTPIWNLAGPRVAIGPDRRDLLPLYTRWQADATTQYLLGLAAPTTLEEQTLRYDSQASPGETIHFTIWERTTTGTALNSQWCWSPKL